MSWVIAIDAILCCLLPRGAGGFRDVALTCRVADHLHLMKDSFF